MRSALCQARLLAPALLLLALVVSSANTNLAYAQSGIFKITLMVPQPNTARQSWSLVIQNNLQSLGIDVGRIVLDWNTIYSRALTPDPSVLGKTYDEGGFDALFVGYALGIDGDPWSLYHSTQLAPTGSNYYLWNNTQNDQLTSQIKETVDKSQRLALVRQWQELAHEEEPSVAILYTREIVAFDSTMSNAASVFASYHYPAWPPIEQLSMTGGATTGSIILAQTGPSPSEGLNPLLSTSYYDLTVFGQVFSALAQRNDTVFKNMVPQLATGWSVTPDQKTWTVTLRQGVTWHDGTPFNATDVKFTFDAMQDDNLAAPNEAFVKGILGGSNNVQIIDPYTLTFSLPVPYAYFVENILTIPIIPSHILSRIQPSDWRSDPFNTGIGGGPVGTGPYKFVSYDSTIETNHLTRNDNYFDFPQNGKTALQNRGAFQVQDYYVRHITGSDAAITAIKTGAVNILDPQYHLETQTNFLTEWGSSNWVSYDAFGVQEMGFNMKHPIFGTGTATPLGQLDPSKSALAAKYVRQAISHAVPRDLLIQLLLSGYGNPGITTPIVGNSQTGFAVTEGFNSALAPYSFNLTKSRELLQAAGYFPAPSQPLSVWETYGFYLTAVLVAAAAVLATLYFMKVKRRALAHQSTASPTTTITSQ